MKRKFWPLLALGLAVAAVAQELNKPAAERTWTGKVAGIVPYDFRMPTASKVRSRVWNPDDPRILVPHVFGVGWTVNAGRVVSLLTSKARSGEERAA